jgi:hypothetical protein
VVHAHRREGYVTLNPVIVIDRVRVYAPCDGTHGRCPVCNEGIVTDLMLGGIASDRSVGDRDTVWLRRDDTATLPSH